MDRDEKLFQHYHAAADAGGKVKNTLENLRLMSTAVYTMGAGEGMAGWRPEDRDLFLDMLLDAGDGRPFIPVPSAWPTEINEIRLVAYQMLQYADQFKNSPELAAKFRDIAMDLGNGV